MLFVSLFCWGFFPTRKLANSPERHAEHTISQRLRQHHPERRQEVRLRATSGKLQKFNYVIRRVKPCRAQLEKNNKKKQALLRHPLPQPLCAPSPETGAALDGWPRSQPASQAPSRSQRSDYSGRRGKRQGAPRIWLRARAAQGPGQCLGFFFYK